MIWIQDKRQPSGPVKLHLVSFCLDKVHALHVSVLLKVLGMGEEWRGGDVRNYPGGGHKINILKKETELHKNESNLVLMFVDR